EVVRAELALLGFAARGPELPTAVLGHRESVEVTVVAAVKPLDGDDEGIVGFGLVRRRSGCRQEQTDASQNRTNRLPHDSTTFQRTPRGRRFRRVRQPGYASRH